MLEASNIAIPFDSPTLKIWGTNAALKGFWSVKETKNMKMFG